GGNAATPGEAGTLGSSGSPAENNTGRRFRLRIGLGGGTAGYTAVCELYDGGRGLTLFRRNIPLDSLSPADTAAFARALGDAALGGDYR
ncbi:MAG: hypothetical protein LBT93_06810, partial [Treponema sp.]|nr:hypothetical protein [Treponema sp.]